MQLAQTLTGNKWKAVWYQVVFANMQITRPLFSFLAASSLYLKCDGALGRILTFMSLGRLLPSTTLSCSAHQAQQALTHIAAGPCKLSSLWAHPLLKIRLFTGCWSRLWFDTAISHLCVGEETNHKTKKSKVSWGNFIQVFKMLLHFFNSVQIESVEGEQISFHRV